MHPERFGLASLQSLFGPKTPASVPGPYPNTSTAFRILRTQTSFPSTSIIAASPAAARSASALANLAGAQRSVLLPCE